VSRDQLAGFMLGMSVGILVGFLMPRDDNGVTATGHTGEVDLDSDESVKHMPAPAHEQR
jgi:hypothetical protein